MLGGKGKGGRVGQLESPSGTEMSPCLRVANLQKFFLFLALKISISIDYIARRAHSARTPEPYK
jgi:hypothetical protein